MIRISHLLASMALALPLGGTLAAPPLQAQSFDHALSVRVLPGWREADGTHIAALALDLAPGWKTYWRAPGDAGIPPRFDFSGSKNVDGVRSHWPVPEVFWQNGLRSIGYEDQVVIPLMVTPSGAGATVLNGDVEVGVCEDICIPMSFSFRVELPEKGRNDSEIRAALSSRMLSEYEGYVASVTCTAAPIADGLMLTTVIDMPPHGADEQVVVETSDRSIWASVPKIERVGDALHVRNELVPPNGQPFALDRSGLRITVFSDGGVVDIQGCTGG